MPHGGTVMSKPKRRRRWTAEKKLKIVLETLQSDQKLAEICRREGISPTQVYHWRKQLLGSGEAMLARWGVEMGGVSPSAPVFVRVCHHAAEDSNL